MDPPPDFSIAGIAYFEPITALFIFKSIDLCQSSSSISVTIPPPGPPTLLKRISNLLNCLIDSLIISSQSFSEVTSPIKIFPIPPSFSITFSVSSALSMSISQSKILAPSLAINIEAACPVPAISPRVPAPVTIATLSSNLFPKAIIFS